MLGSTRKEQEEAAWLALKRREEDRAKAAAKRARQKELEDQYDEEVSAWEVVADELLERGRELFGSDQDVLKALSSVVDRRAEAREQQARDDREKLRKFYANLSDVKALIYATLRGIFVYAPLCLLLAIFLEVCQLPSIFAGAIAVITLGLMIYRRFVWIKSMRQEGPALSGNEAEAPG